MTSTLAEHIRDGTFPESDKLLNQEMNAEELSSLSTSLAELKRQLKTEIEEVSQDIAGDVDEWIAQAKKLQEDIERCKIEARKIVKEHEHGRELGNEVKDIASKMKLLESEIEFTLALDHEIQNISEVSQVLNEASNDLGNQNPVSTVEKLTSLRAAIENISAKKTQSFLSQLTTELSRGSRRNLENLLASRWTVLSEGPEVLLKIRSRDDSHKAFDSSIALLTTDNIVQALSELQALPSVTDSVVSTTESFMLSAVIPSSAPFPSAAIVKGETLTITRSDERKNAREIVSILGTVLQFLHENVPQQMKSSFARGLLPKVINSLVSEWLDPAIPFDLHDQYMVEPLQDDVAGLAAQLHRYSWPGDETLREWIDGTPRSWLAKRRIASLDAVRKAFASARGTMRLVERIERQKVSVQRPPEKSKDHDDEWSADWDDQPQPSRPADTKEADDDDTTGWDFETDDQESDSAKPQDSKLESEEDDTSDAWGWGDDDTANEESHQPKRLIQTKPEETNGVEEMVLKELYHISDIPDYILEIIGRDMADSHELRSSPSKYFGNRPPAEGLANLSNLTLALFRAIAPTYYTLSSATYNLSNMNLYNDILYILQKLTENSDSSSLQPSIQSLNRFARQVYSSELDVQRTVLADLLDGAQGFVRCTAFPNSQACIDAVSSTIDRLRQLHQEWSVILGESHLFQSLGSLVTMIFGKIIKDIEDMDDVSEAESKQLVTFCQQVLTLEELFSPRSSTTTNSANEHLEQEQQPATQILLYVPNYLRFQYLQQILDSSLVDIKYLWTEGELSLEFSADEVEDLIKALFAESQYRRDAIRTIRSSVVR